MRAFPSRARVSQTSDAVHPAGIPARRVLGFARHDKGADFRVQIFQLVG